METLSSQLPQPQALQSTTTDEIKPSSKNLKAWFDEFKARVSKKSSINLQTNSDATQSNDEQNTSKINKEFGQNPFTRTKSPSLRARRLIKQSTSDCSQDFDHASNDPFLFRHNDSAKLVESKQRGRLTSGTIAIAIWLINYLIPFNYNLPWKLLCLINSSFVIIVIGLVSGSSHTYKAFSFFNGFICGIIVATLCFVILTVSFVFQILPKTEASDNSKLAALHTDSPGTLNHEALNKSKGNISNRSHQFHSDVTATTDQNFESFSVLGSSEGDIDEQALSLSAGEKFDDENYKGWMIEFIGDYEQRNTSEIKLKSVYVKIENRILHVCKPKSNNHEYDLSSLPNVAQRVYDLNNVFKLSANLLLPKSVRNKQKYMWSKKYPIRLEFQENRTNEMKLQDSPTITKLTLFAKSCREKEEWFRRFKQIVEENRFVRLNNLCCPRSKRSLDSEGILVSQLNRCESPTVQTSRSSHMLLDSMNLKDEGENTSPSGLVRTKSCDLLSAEQISGVSNSVSGIASGLNSKPIQLEPTSPDDSTLTKETADLFNQNIQFSRFIESLPSLDYSEYINRHIEASREASPTTNWFNALTGRIFFDLFSQNYWSMWFKRKLQRKLYRIRLPYFMETLSFTHIDLGTNAPQFLNVISHNFDSCGLSIDFDMSYSGGLTMTFETKLNLLKIKPETATSNSSTTNSSNPFGSSSDIGSASPTQKSDTSIKSANPATSISFENFSNDVNKDVPSSSSSARTSGDMTSSESSDSDSSSDSSLDDAGANEISDWEDYGAEKTRQNIVRFVDKIASSRYFQHATENRYIKKKLQDISNCPLVLVVQIQSLNGVLTLNVPPPQTDRIWYGFKQMPELTLKALPKMGDREVNLSHVTDWIERKLSDEFRKIFVIPNMEDIVLPVLRANYMQYISTSK